MNRRTFLLGMLAAMKLTPPALSEQKDLTLVLATDLHYISPELTDNGPYFTRMVENADGKVMTKIEPLTEAFVEEMIAMKPDALILSGDLTFNGAKKSHEDLVKKLLRIREAGVSVYAKAASLTDPDLVDFPTFSDAFFKLTTVRQAQALFGDSDDGKALADYLAAVNACYFSGRMDLCPVDEAHLARWMEQGAFFSSYLRSIFAEPAADHTAYTRSF